MTGLELNYFRILRPDGEILTDVTLVTGDYWATLTPNIYLSDGVTYSVEADGRINDGGTVKAIAVGTWEFTIAQPATDYIYEEDFSGTPYSIPHQLSEAQCISQFDWEFVRNANAGTVHLDNDPEPGGNRSPVLRVDFVEGEWGYGHNGVASGMQAKINWPGGVEKEELYMAFDVFFPDSFIFNFACKIWGVFTDGALDDPAGEYGRVGVDMWGNNDFINSFTSPFPNCTVDGEIAVYQYYEARSGHAQQTARSYGQGVWSTIEIHAKMNTPRSSVNGEYHVYKNGQLISSSTNRQWSTIAHAWNHCRLVLFAGGGSDKWRWAQNQSAYFDNFIISDNPITH